MPTATHRQTAKVKTKAEARVGEAEQKGKVDAARADKAEGEVAGARAVGEAALQELEALKQVLIDAKLPVQPDELREGI